MSDQHWYRKEVESEQLGFFLAEYESITGRSLGFPQSSESPDFICSDAAGNVVGVELVRTMLDPEAMMWRRILDNEYTADAQDTWIRAQCAIWYKDEQRKKPHWQTPEHTILVVQLMDCPLEDVAKFMDDDLIEECCQTGFREIWLADYTLIAPFDTVQLYGLKANGFAGLHKMQQARSWKPYA